MRKKKKKNKNNNKKNYKNKNYNKNKIYDGSMAAAVTNYAISIFAKGIL